MHLRAYDLCRSPEIHVLVNDLAIYEPKALIELSRSVGFETILLSFSSNSSDEGAITDLN